MSESNIGNLLVSTIQPLEAGRIVEMNIERNVALQKFLCCDAANRKMHGIGKKRLTVRHGCPKIVLLAQYFAEFEQKARLLSYFDSGAARYLNADGDGRLHHRLQGSIYGSQTPVLRSAAANQACVIRMH
jgi:hypothetical protein